MGEKPGIFKNIISKLGKNKKSVKTQRVLISDAQKLQKPKHQKQQKSKHIKEKPLEPVLEPIDSEIFEETFLEDTPKEGIQKVTKQAKKSEKKKKEKITAAATVVKEKKHAATPKRYKKKKAFFSGILDALPLHAKKETKNSNSSALEFAANDKRIGRKGRKRRRIMLYAGTGIIVVVVMLVVLLVPGGAAAPASVIDAQGSESQTEMAALTEEQTELLLSESSLSYYDASETGASQGTAESTAFPTETPSSTPVATTTPGETPVPVNISNETESYMVEADLYYNQVGYSSNTYKYSDEEFYMLAQVMYLEARGEGMNGMIAVGNVVMNRVLCRGYPGNSIKAIVTAKNQFAYNPNTRPSMAAKSAARYVLDYEVWKIPQNIYYFKVSGSKSNWGSHVYQFNIGRHAFYSHSYSGRYRGKTPPPPLFERTYKWPTFGCKPEMRVYKVQYMLNKLGYSVKADKYFGKDTKDALIDFQKKNGLKADGIAGPSTIEALITEFGLVKYYAAFMED